MRLIALSIGDSLRGCALQGVVHAVFRRACTIRSRSGELYTLLDASAANQPLGIRLATPPAFAFDRFVSRHSSVAWWDGCLRVGSGDLVVDLHGASIWRGDLAGLEVDRRSPAARRAWRSAWLEMRRASRGGLPSLIGRARAGSQADDDHPVMRGLAGQLRGLLPELAEAAGALNAGEVAARLGRLTGKGIGLTPSGDDFVVGFLASQWAGAARDEARCAYLAALDAALLPYLARTSDISRAFLRQAATGKVCEPLFDLAACITGGHPPDAARGATGWLLQFGHTSGADSALGLLVGLATTVVAARPTIKIK
jgi:hypothetical protein